MTRADYLIWFALGLAAWSAAEYAVHRFVLHGAWRAAHFRHHAVPADYSAGPSWLVIALVASAIALALALTIGIAFMHGAAFGLVLYLYVHWFCHHGSPRSTAPPMLALRRLHAIHHDRGNRNFGVTSPLWDVVFGSFEARREINKA